MARVICNLPNASEEISGVAFKQSEHGMLSADISDAQAAAFTEIKGYVLADADGNPLAADDDGDEGAADAANTDLAPLTARAKELGIAVKSNWKAARLAAEIKRAEDALPPQ